MKSPNKPIERHEIECIREYYVYGAKKCASILGCKVGRVARIANKIGLKHTPEERGAITSLAAQRPDDQHDVLIGQFVDPDKLEVAYLLGYMWADGYVRRTRHAYIFCLAILEKDYLSIKRTLDMIGKWRVYRSVNAAGNVVANIQTSNIKLVKWMLEMDYGRKSYVAPVKIIQHLPERLRSYFWRGYMDGDGHFRIAGGLYHFTFTADYTYDWTQHIALLNELGIKYKVSRRVQAGGRKSDVVCSNMTGTYAFGQYIYSGRETDAIGLDRKYHKWLLCKQRVEDARKTAEVKLKQSPLVPLTDDILLEIVKEHNGVIGQKTIARHYGLKGWQVSEITQRLCKKGKIGFIGNTSSVRYVLVHG